MSKFFNTNWMCLFLNQKRISLENFDDSSKDAALINTPRSLEACRRQGIEPHEIVYTTLKRYKKSLGVEANQLTPQILQLRFEHFDQRRKEKIQILNQERNNIIREEAQGLWSSERNLALNSQLSKHSGGGSGHKQLSGSKGGRLSSAVALTSPSKMDSAMLERERQALEKIKLKQQKELE